MAMLLQQIGRRATSSRLSLSAGAAGLGATFSRRGTAALTPPPPMAAFSRFYSNNRAPGPEKEKTFAGIFGKFVLKYGLTVSFMLGVFRWVDYGGYWTTAAEWEKLMAELEKERMANREVRKQLDEIRKPAQMGGK